jgi:phosphatidylglycerophosphate synthase
MRVMPAAPDAGALRGSALASILPAVAVGSLVATVLGEAVGLSPAYAWRAALLLVAGGAVLVGGLGAHPHPRFGAANQLTLLRAVGVVLLLAMLGESRVPQPAAFVIALVAALIDACDGRVARRRGLTSRYGARFDMETDALLILALALLLWTGGRLGAWVLACGALRYAFIAATLLLPRLRGELAPSRRRQAFAVLQVATLLAAFAPFVPQRLAVLAAAAGLAGLAASFAIDVRASWRAQMPTG